MDKSFAKESIEGFLEKLGSGEPTPGGGAAAALCSAQGASLLMMVANHTIGRARYAEFEDLNTIIRDEAEALRARFIEGIDKDAEAFLKVSAAYKMSGEGRSEAISSASVEAAEAPLSVMEDSLSALRLAGSMKGRSNPNLESDILVAALCLHAGLISAGFNVDANLPAIRKKDPALAESMASRADMMREESARLTKEITGRD